MFRAYDKRSGAVQAEIELPERATGAPMTYLHRGRQYIVIAVGSQSHASELVALALPGAKPASQPTLVNERTAPVPPTAAPVQVTAAQLARGRSVYERSCAACHGLTGAGVGNAPKLGKLTDITAIATKIRTGGVEMPPMTTLLADEEIDAVARFVAAEM
jgi:quinoprotein glucose dehydrogenase